MWAEGSATYHKWNSRRIKWDLEATHGLKIIHQSYCEWEIYGFVGMTIKFFVNREDFKIKKYYSQWIVLAVLVAI